jgi:hypothetical protein
MQDSTKNLAPVLMIVFFLFLPSSALLYGEILLGVGLLFAGYCIWRLAHRRKRDPL